MKPKKTPGTQRRRLTTLALAAMAVLAACGDDDDAAAPVTATPETDAIAPIPSPDARSGPTVIVPGMTWNWQLQDELDLTIDADIYDIDLFDTAADTIAQLHADDRIVICYFSTAWEDWRADAGQFPDASLGRALDDWEGERWVDVRDPGVRDVLAERLDLALQQGCDGVEPDNVTAYRNDTGFDLTEDDQLEFNRFLAAEAHDRGLLIGLKNALELIPELVDDFDFAVNEQCVQYDECDVYAPFVAAGKAVLGAEYSDAAVRDPATTCEIASAAGVAALILPLELDGSFRTACP